MSAAAADRTRAAPRKLTLCLVWLAVTGIFGAYGLHVAKERYGWLGGPTPLETLEGICSTGALGTGPATCLSVGLFALGQVKRGFWRKRSAALGMLALPVPCALLTAFSFIAVQELFQSEQAGLALIFWLRRSLIDPLAIAIPIMLLIVGCKIEPVVGERGDAEHLTK
jgi:hypothetical protein